MRGLDGLAYLRLEADDSAIAWQELAGNFPTEDERAGVVLLHRYSRVAIGLGRAWDVLQPGRQAVRHGHIGDRPAADVAVFQVEGDDLANLAGRFIRPLAEQEGLVAFLRRLANTCNDFRSIDLRDDDRAGGLIEAGDSFGGKDLRRLLAATQLSELFILQSLQESQGFVALG